MVLFIYSWSLLFVGPVASRIKPSHLYNSLLQLYARRALLARACTPQPQPQPQPCTPPSESSCSFFIAIKNKCERGGAIPIGIPRQRNTGFRFLPLNFTRFSTPLPLSNFRSFHDGHNESREVILEAFSYINQSHSPCQAADDGRC